MITQYLFVRVIGGADGNSSDFYKTHLEIIRIIILVIIIIIIPKGPST